MTRRGRPQWRHGKRRNVPSATRVRCVLKLGRSSTVPVSKSTQNSELVTEEKVTRIPSYVTELATEEEVTSNPYSHQNFLAKDFCAAQKFADASDCRVQRFFGGNEKTNSRNVAASAAPCVGENRRFESSSRTCTPLERNLPHATYLCNVNCSAVATFMVMR